MTRAVFLDRDGVIVEDIGYHYKIEDFKFVKNAIKGLKLLKNLNLFMVTNQSGIGRGYYTLEDFEKFNIHLLKELKKRGIKIVKTYYCQHKPEDNCECRKPKTKLLKVAEKEFMVDLKKSFVIGDRKKDIELGKNAGCRTILVLSGKGTEEKKNSEADFIGKDLLEAAKWVISNE